MNAYGPFDPIPRGTIVRYAEPTVENREYWAKLGMEWVVTEELIATSVTCDVTGHPWFVRASDDEAEVCLRPSLFKPVGKDLGWGWKVVVEPNEDRPGVNVYLEHSSGECGSLACAENEGVIGDYYKVPRRVLRAVYDWIDEAEIDY